MARQRFQRFTLGALAFAGVVVASARCSDGGSPPPTAPDRSAINRPGLPVLARVTPEAQRRAKDALERGKWAGEIHRLAMAELIADKAAWRGARRRGAAGNCAIALRIAQKHLPLAAKHIGPSLARPRKMPKGLDAQLGCPSGSLDALAGGAGQLSLFAQEEGLPPGVTGEYEQYAWALEDAYYSAQSPDEVANNTYAVISQAAANGLGQPDLDYLAVIGDISISSSYQWYEFESSGGLDDPDRKDGLGEEPMSLFGTQIRLNRWGKIGIADLGGALMGSRGGPYWALAGGLVASVVFAINTT